MSNELAGNILEVCAEAFTSARRNIVFAMSLLYKINKEDSWNTGEYSSFSEYVEQKCQISRGYASKLLAVWEYYAIQGKVSQQNLETVDTDKLYYALRLPGNPVEKLEKALGWTRQEIRDELAAKDGHDCLHEKTVTICATCGKRI